MNILGFDIGGSSVKYGLVNMAEDFNLQSFNMIPLPYTASPQVYAKAIAEILPGIPNFDCVGVGFPRIIIDNQVIEYKTKLDQVWNSVFLSNKLFSSSIPCFAINDADAAGLAEVHRPDAQDLRRGVTIVVTFGTGIGSAIFLDGKLLPNTEMGLFEMNGIKAENYAASSIKTLQGLSMEEWAKRLQNYLLELEMYLSPDHIVLGGGISADFEQFCQFLHTRAKLQPAQYRNQAGVIGSAMYAAICSGSFVIN